MRNSIALNCKTVEILEGEDDTEESRDVIRLIDVWSVQDRPSRNKGRYTFEVSAGGREMQGKSAWESRGSLSLPTGKITLEWAYGSDMGLPWLDV